MLISLLFKEIEVHGFMAIFLSLHISEHVYKFPETTLTTFQYATFCIIHIALHEVLT
jgi:hypothetical protein